MCGDSDNHRGLSGEQSWDLDAQTGAVQLTREEGDMFQVTGTGCRCWTWIKPGALGSPWAVRRIWLPCGYTVNSQGAGQLCRQPHQALVFSAGLLPGTSLSFGSQRRLNDSNNTWDSLCIVLNSRQD